jgi:hypothetical protein
MQEQGTAAVEATTQIKINVQQTKNILCAMHAGTNWMHSMLTLQNMHEYITKL